ncbi:MAG: ABC transporter permease [Patescibacteria group bacterium]
MSLINYIKISLQALIQNKVRTLLTLLGIVIGIGSVISLMAISNGATNSITSQLSSLGTNLVTISPGAQQTGGGPRPNGGAGVSYLEVDVLNQIENKLPTSLFDRILPTRTSSATITYKDKTQSLNIQGISEGYFNYNSVTVNSGRLLNDNEITRGANQLILPQETANKLFINTDPIGKFVSVNNQELEIVGISKPTGIGSSQAIASIKFVQDKLAQKDNYSSIVISAKDGKPDQVKNILKEVLLKYFDTTEEEANFNITTSQSILDTVSTITNTLSIMLVAVGGISLVVGGIGIMNIMLVTVTERTKEIGLRKALGAKVKDILTQFLTEAIIVTVIGGVLGIGLGYIVSLVSTYVFNFPAPITWNAIAIAVGVSSLIGIVFGFYPAWKASKLQPIDALRSE